MRRRTGPLAASLLLLAMLILPAGATSRKGMEPGTLLPVDIVINQDTMEIRKVYDLSPSTDPSTLPMDDFERDGTQYACSDILREVIIGSEIQTITQTETVDSTKKDMETILELLSQERDITTEDGFSGTLRLVLDSIKTEPSSYGSSTKPITATRSYPNLSSADTNHLPKTITEGGQTLTLQNIQWQTDNTYNADDYEIGDRFTAICTYGGSKTVSYVTGYTTTADYIGEVYRTGVTVIRYTVIYTGMPIAPTKPEPELPSQPEPVMEDKADAEVDWPLVILPALAALISGAGTYFIMKRKERAGNEEPADDCLAGDYARHDDYDSYGSGV